MVDTYSKKLANISKKLNNAEKEFYKASSEAERAMGQTYEKTARVKRVAERREESYRRAGKTDLADALGRMVEFTEEKNLAFGAATENLEMLETSMKMSLSKLTGTEIKRASTLPNVVKMADRRAKNIANVAKTIEQYEPEAAAQLYEAANKFAEIAEEAGKLAKEGMPLKVVRKAAEKAEA